MLAELKAKSQVTIPKSIVSELGLERGDMFEVAVDGGNVVLVPVVVYPKEKAAALDALAQRAREEAAEGDAEVFEDVEDAIEALHEAL